MDYGRTFESSYVRVDVFDHQSSRDAESFLRAMTGAKRRFDHHRILLNFRVSGMSPMPVLAYCELVRLAERWSARKGGRIALVGDTPEVRQLNRMAQSAPYSPRVSIRAFEDVPAAFDWVLGSA
jgi:hypothetical protein